MILCKDAREARCSAHIDTTQKERLPSTPGPSKDRRTESSFGGRRRSTQSKAVSLRCVRDLTCLQEHGIWYQSGVGADFAVRNVSHGKSACIWAADRSVCHGRQAQRVEPAPRARGSCCAEECHGWILPTKTLRLTHIISARRTRSTRHHWSFQTAEKCPARAIVRYKHCDSAARTSTRHGRS